MIYLKNSIQAWGKPEFGKVFKQEFEQLPIESLPLQQALQFSNAVASNGFSVMLLEKFEVPGYIQLRIAVLYQGVVAGCNCADDPTHQEFNNEYCELAVQINQATAETSICLPDPD